MDHSRNKICKVCMCQFIDVKQICNFSEAPKEVIGSASVQLLDIPEQICSKCLESEQNKVGIKTEFDGINIDEAIVNICKPEEVDIKEEHEEQCEILPEYYKTPLEGATNDKNIKQSTSLETEENVSNKKLYKCQDCNKQFGKKSRLTEHKKIHTESRPLQCEICNRQFTTSFNIRRHMQSHEFTKQDVYKCDVCHKKLLSAGALKYHMKGHTGEKPYKCDVCHKDFYRSGELIRHQRGHTGEKPFKCDVCDKQFTVASNLKLHKQIHTPSREKVHECDVCQKKFYDLPQLKRHLGTHREGKPFKCDVCDKEFKKKHNLKHHKHLQLFKCSICCQNFDTAKQLRNHQKTHGGKKRFFIRETTSVMSSSASMSADTFC